MKNNHHRNQFYLRWNKFGQMGGRRSIPLWNFTKTGRNDHSIEKEVN